MFSASAKILIYFENLSKYLTSSRYEFAVDFQAAIKLKLTIHQRGGGGSKLLPTTSGKSKFNAKPPL